MIYWVGINGIVKIVQVVNNLKKIKLKIDVFSLTLAILYSTHFDLKPIYLSSIFELILMIILIFMKFIYTNNKIDTNILLP
jgi:hypothetical protein